MVGFSVYDGHAVYGDFGCVSVGEVGAHEVVVVLVNFLVGVMGEEGLVRSVFEPPKRL